ncbi:hypothetical protein [Nocardia sp. NPDC058633]|uniref:hypothetical protein n=1 Tax=Nocardia sp. NPDC058633 TaxID=3346568 RepID=UPI0036462AD9
MKLTGRDGSVWHITAGPSGHLGTPLDGRYAPPRRCARHMPDWLDALLVRLGQWLGDRSGIGRP